MLTDYHHLGTISLLPPEDPHPVPYVPERNSHQEPATRSPPFAPKPTHFDAALGEDFTAKTVEPPHDPKSLNFTIVILAYKAPKSLTALLQSLHHSGIIYHGQLQEIVVYFQAMNRLEDVDVVTAALEEWPGAKRQLVRITGKKENLPVAKATFAALDNVRTKLVLYLECDRPALSYQPLPESAPQIVDNRRLIDLKREQDRVVANNNNNDNNDRDDHRDRRRRHQQQQDDTSSTTEKSELDVAKDVGIDSDQHKRLMYPAIQIIDTAIRTLARRSADVFRLQVYANPDLPHAEPQLQEKHYGPGPYYAKCGRAPYFNHKFCIDAKLRGDRSLYNAYCKHWYKLQRQKQNHQDMCDATCFVRWRDMVAVAEGKRPDEKQGDWLHRQEELGVNATFMSTVSEFAKQKMLRRVSVIDGEAEQVLCTDSGLCNWTNQPTMYFLDWYKKNVKEPCLKNPKQCVGQAGRRSAVLQEVFFVKSKADWADRRHNICVHRRGLFIHQEVDN